MTKRYGCLDGEIPQYPKRETSQSRHPAFDAKARNTAGASRALFESALANDRRPRIDHDAETKPGCASDFAAILFPCDSSYRARKFMFAVSMRPYASSQQ